jgi:hypothetical protein
MGYGYVSFHPLDIDSCGNRKCNGESFPIKCEFGMFDRLLLLRNFISDNLDLIVLIVLLLLVYDCFYLGLEIFLELN